MEKSNHTPKNPFRHNPEKELQKRLKHAKKLSQEDSIKKAKAITRKNKSGNE